MSANSKAAQMLEVSRIRLNDENPRLIKEAKFHDLVTSLEDFPEMMRLRPAVLDEEHLVLGGNMRTRAKLHLLGLEEQEKQERIEAAVTRRLEQDPDANADDFRPELVELFYEQKMPVYVAKGLTARQKQEFIIKDNAGFGEWDWDLLANGDWPELPLDKWGMDLPTDWLKGPEVLDDISLPDGEKPPFKTVTFILTDLQAQDLETALGHAKETEDFEGTGNDNSNGNALAAIVAAYNSMHNVSAD